jgi:hypothetical protein
MKGFIELVSNFIEVKKNFDFYFFSTGAIKIIVELSAIYTTPLFTCTYRPS